MLDKTDIVSNWMYQDYAALLIASRDKTDAVEKCVNQEFDGDWLEFTKAADWYNANGCGVAG